MNTITLCDQFKPIRIRKNLVVNCSWNWWCSIYWRPVFIQGMHFFNISAVKMWCLFDGSIWSSAVFIQVNTTFTFTACTYHTVFRANAEQPPAHVTLTNVPLPIVVILLFEIYLKMQSLYLITNVSLHCLESIKNSTKSKLQNNHQQLTVQCSK